MKNYYKILEVEENATDEQIKKSFRNLSKQYHPDINPNGSEKFKEINEAYEVLSDREKRHRYDNTKNNPYANTNFEDFFSQMFRGNFQNMERRKNAPDKLVKLQISPIESYLGSEKSVNYLREIHCNSCNGSGGDQQICKSCGGSGAQIKTFGTGFMVQQIRTICQDCGGKGYTIVHKCFYCDGKGANQQPNEIKISIPMSSDNGQFLKIKDAGDFRHGEYGDLLIQLEMVPKDGFEKINNDLIYNLEMNFEQANKEKYIIPHPSGELVVSSPPIIDTSRPLRLKGKGFNGGDMYVKLVLKFARVI